MLLLASDLGMRADPARLLRRLLGHEPDEWQQDLLRSRSPRILMLCSRQSGKTTSAAALGLHTALYEANSLVLIASPGLRQSGELFKRILAGYRLLDRPVKALQETALTLTLANGSRIVSLPGNEAKIRTYSGVRLLLFEEAARIPSSLYMACRPMLAVSAGRIVLLSSAFHERGFFFDEWRLRHEWDFYSVNATQCRRISAAFLEEERRRMGDLLYEQEYMNVFHPSAGQAFARKFVEAALQPVDLWDFPDQAASAA